ncbi:MAG: hypothetical protein KBT47_07335, partial [Armatimonadetes bacterium]|nr:hypothetical protein [Candidatus Hippobium faecium]
YDFFMERVRQFGNKGFRCVLWHQGEGDFFATSDYYFDMVSEIINASRNDAGWFIPWFTAKATYIPEFGLSENIRNAQQKLWDEGISYEGPDTDTLLKTTDLMTGKGYILPQTD